MRSESLTRRMHTTMTSLKLTSSTMLEKWDNSHMSHEANIPVRRLLQAGGSKTLKGVMLCD